MCSRIVFVLCLVSILCQSIDDICQVFAPNGVFTGIQMYNNFSKKDISNKSEYRVMYKSGANGAEWEVRISDNKSIEFIGKSMKCCENYLNQFVTYADLPKEKNDLIQRRIRCHTLYVV